MNILFLTHRLPYAPNRGDRIRAYHLIRVLSQRADVHLVSLAHDEDEWSRQADLRELTASTDVARVIRWQRLAAGGLSLAGRQPLTHTLLHARAIYPLLRRRLADVRPDVVLAFCSGMARYACEPVLARLPFVFDLVDVDSQKWRQLSTESPWPQRWIYSREARLLRRFESAAIAQAAATTVVSGRERDLLDESERPSVHVVPNGIDLEGFTPPGPPSDEPRVVFCGVFNYAPNERGALWFAREVWPAVRASRPDAMLTLVGMHPTPAIERLADDPSIDVTGGVPDVRPYLWRSAVAIAPLDIARGLQNKVLEALASGLPTVTTRAVAEGLPESALAGCEVPEDAAAWARAVTALLESAPDARRARAARAQLADLTWERQLAPMHDLLEDAVARGRHGH